MATILCSLSSKVNKDNGRSEILLRFRNGRQVNVRGHSRIWIYPRYMNQSKGEMVITSRKLTPEVKEMFVLKSQLEKLVNHLVVEAQKRDAEATGGDWLQNEIDKFMFPEDYAAKEAKAKLGFFEAFENFLANKDFSEGRIRHYNVLIRTLRRWELYRGKELSLDEMTSEDLNEYRIFIRDEHKLFRENKAGEKVPVAKYKKVFELIPETKIPNKRGDNYINSLFKMLRAFYSWCNDQDVSPNDPFKKFTVGSQTYGTPIYISIEERDQIAEASMGGNKHLETQRDIFIFQCFIGCRVSDLYAMTKANVVEDIRGTYIEYLPHKTKDKNPNVVKVYLTEKAIEILEKYKDCHPRYLFPFISQQKYNDAIKDVFHKAGIERMVTVRNSVTGQSEQKSIADVASSHLARRTFVGNLYKQVKDPSLVGKLSGHKEGSRAFARYRAIDDDMVKELTDLLGGNVSKLTLDQKKAIVLREAKTKEEMIKKQTEIQRLLSTGLMTMEEYIDIQTSAL